MNQIRKVSHIYSNSDDECPIDHEPVVPSHKPGDETPVLPSLSKTFSFNSNDCSKFKHQCCVLLIRKPNDEKTDKYFEDIAIWLANKKKTVYTEESAIRDAPESIKQILVPIDEESKKCISFIITIGGDGTILWAVQLYKISSIPPIISFAMGSMGYLCVFEVEKWEEILERIHQSGEHKEASEIRLDHRMRLSCSIVDEENKVSHLKKEVITNHGATKEMIYIHHIQAFNEITIDRGPSQFITNFECHVNGKYLTNVQGDGLLVATPSGSTAYSLAAGGSMVYPSVSAILLTPMCPHSLSFRPVIFPDYCYLTIHIPREARSNVWVSIDGHTRFELERTQRIVIKASNHPVRFVTFKDKNKMEEWFTRLRQCLNWNVRPQQKAL